MEYFPGSGIPQLSVVSTQKPELTTIQVTGESSVTNIVPTIPTPINPFENMTIIIEETTVTQSPQVPLVTPTITIQSTTTTFMYTTISPEVSLVTPAITIQPTTTTFMHTTTTLSSEVPLVTPTIAIQPTAITPIQTTETPDTTSQLNIFWTTYCKNSTECKSCVNKVINCKDVNYCRNDGRYDHLRFCDKNRHCYIRHPRGHTWKKRSICNAEAGEKYELFSGKCIVPEPSEYLKIFSLIFYYICIL